MLKVRMQAVDIFGAFDCPDAGQMKPRRTRSIAGAIAQPTQRPFASRQAGFFAVRVRHEQENDSGDPRLRGNRARSQPPRTGHAYDPRQKP